ncbi:hypothetical protein B0H11DRAFT_2354411 [Mycena galericulata]|nr:hypothetical protein B0H11DRAFT_2354411 [Mycena galericulata]
MPLRSIQGREKPSKFGRLSALILAQARERLVLLSFPANEVGSGGGKMGQSMLQDTRKGPSRWNAPSSKCTSPGPSPTKENPVKGKDPRTKIGHRKIRPHWKRRRLAAPAVCITIAVSAPDPWASAPAGVGATAGEEKKDGKGNERPKARMPNLILCRYISGLQRQAPVRDVTPTSRRIVGFRTSGNFSVTSTGLVPSLEDVAKKDSEEDMPKDAFEEGDPGAGGLACRKLIAKVTPKKREEDVRMPPRDPSGKFGRLRVRTSTRRRFCWSKVACGSKSDEKRRCD